MSAREDWIYGLHAVEAALRNDPENVRVVRLEQGRRDRRMRDLTLLAEQAGVPVEQVRRQVLEGALPKGARHQGVVAAYAAAPVQDEAALDAILAKAGEPPFLLALDGVTDPHNLGACLRTADAVGVQAVILPRDKSVGLTPTVRKVACGAAESVPVIQVTNLARTLRQLQQAGLWVIGAAGEAERNLYELQMATTPLVMVMGAEGTGLRRLTRETCDELVRIPMQGQVGSLNVSVATAVCLYELRRQRLAGA